MHKYFSIITLCFSVFFLWIIYKANTDQDTIFFTIAHSLPYGDKVSHIVVFGLLSYLFNLTMSFKTSNILNLDIYVGSLAVIIISAVDELSQSLIPTRTIDFLDFIASITGIVLFAYITKLTHKNYL